jgi:hypothetical protein
MVSHHEFGINGVPGIFKINRLLLVALAYKYDVLGFADWFPSHTRRRRRILRVQFFVASTLSRAEQETTGPNLGPAQPYIHPFQNSLQVDRTYYCSIARSIDRRGHMLSLRRAAIVAAPAAYDSRICLRRNCIIKSIASSACGSASMSCLPSSFLRYALAWSGVAAVSHR